jgi:replicative DNA helicase
MTTVADDGVWPDLQPLGGADPAPLPVDEMPAVLRDHVLGVAATTQTPTDAAALLALAATSVAIHGRADIAIRSGWPDEGLGVYCGLVMLSGTRKSGVYHHMLAPIERWEAEQAEQMASVTARAQEEHDVLEQRLKQARVQAAKREISMDELEDARRQLADHVVPRARRLIASDVTPEALPRLMQMNGGAVAVCAPEGDPLRIAAGRYSRDSSPNLDVLKRAWSSEKIRIDRVGRPDEYVRRPTLVMAIAMQPVVLETLAHAGTLRGEGLYARFLWCRPVDTVGRRLTGPAVPPLDGRAAAAYGRMIYRLLEVAPNGIDDHGPVRHRIQLDPAAERELWALEARLETRMGEDGDLFGIRDWAAKLCGQVARIAGLLHVVEHDVATPIRGDTMAAAVAWGEALASHALAVLGSSADPRIALQAYIVRRLLELPEHDRNVRELFERTKGKVEISSVADLEEYLDDLHERGYLRVYVQRTGQPGRPPSPRIDLHPDLTPDIRNIRTNAVSADIANAEGDIEDPLDVLRGVA